MLQLFKKIPIPASWWARSLALLGTLMLAAILSVAVVWYRYLTWLETPLSIPASGFHYDLDTGKSLSHVSQELAAKQLLTHPRWLNWYARYYNRAKIHPGEYLLESGLTPVTLLDKLNRGDIVLHQVVLLEGWNFRQIMAALDEKPALTHLLSQKSAEERLQILHLPIDTLEGWFFPDTYSFSKGTSDVEILTQSYKAMRKLLDESWAARAENLPYKSDYQALVMASIVEKETGSPEDRDKIAGVFVRRLQKGMKLQTDPTVIYGMGEGYTGKISRDDLARATPYNTYVISGLPPTPIAIPGKAALHAALHPAGGNALYFVARGDGTSEFSDTLEAHQRAVAKYQLQRSSDYRSTLK